MTLTFDRNDALDPFGDPLYPSEIVTVNRDDVGCSYDIPGAHASSTSNPHEHIQSAVDRIRQLRF